MLPVYNAEKLVHPFMISRLDYCNAVLGGCLASSINKLQIVHNAGQENMIILPQFYSLCTGYLLSSVLVTKYILSKALNGKTKRPDKNVHYYYLAWVEQIICAWIE